MDVDEIVEGVLKLVDQEGAQITDLVVEALYEGTIRCQSIKDEYLQKDDVKKAMEVYTKIAGMYDQIAYKIQNKKHREILRMMADFWTQSGEIELALLKEKKHERTVPKEYMGKQEAIGIEY